MPYICSAILLAATQGPAGVLGVDEHDYALGMAHVFGLTGGIASGKSTVSRRLSARGVPVVDADEVARAVVRPGTAGLAALTEAFGPGILAPDGTLDRKALAAVAFVSRDTQRILNGITHPRIAVETQRRLAAIEGPIACYDAALLVENGLADAFRPLVVVAAPPELQRSRMLSRDGLPTEEADRRIALQKPMADKLAVADYVVQNDKSLDDLTRETDRVLDAILAKLGLAAADFPPPPAAATVGPR
jgi:dephospho-CoA kinase